MFSLLKRKSRAGKEIEPRKPKEKGSKKSKASKKSTAKGQPSKKQCLDNEAPEDPTDIEDERSEEVRRQFELEFSDFDFSDPSDQDRLEQEAELEKLEAKETSEELSKFFKGFKALRYNSQPQKVDGHPIMVKLLAD